MVSFFCPCTNMISCFVDKHPVTALSKRQEKKNAVALESIHAARNIVEVALDPQIAFVFMVRYYRIKYGLTQQQAAKKMGFETIYSYQRLEGRRCNPSLKIITN